MEYLSRREMMRQVHRYFKNMYFTKGSDELKFRSYLTFRLYLFFTSNYVSQIISQGNISCVKIKHKRKFALLVAKLQLLLVILSAITVTDFVVYAVGYPSIIFTRIIHMIEDNTDNKEKDNSKITVNGDSIDISDIVPSSAPFKEDGELDYEKANTYFYGYPDMTISKKNRNIHLVNLKENIVGITYTLVCKDKNIYKDKSVLLPGKSFDVDLYSLLGGKKGVYEVSIVQTYHNLQNFSQIMYSMENDIKVRIE